MTEDELRKKMYWICCPMCDLKKCVKDTPECEAEQWLERKMAKEVSAWSGIKSLQPNTRKAQ